MIEFSCRKCGKQLRVRDEHAGKRGACSCGDQMTIPAAASRITPEQAHERIKQALDEMVQRSEEGQDAQEDAQAVTIDRERSRWSLAMALEPTVSDTIGSDKDYVSLHDLLDPVAEPDVSKSAELSQLNTGFHPDMPSNFDRKLLSMTLRGARHVDGGVQNVVAWTKKMADAFDHHWQELTEDQQARVFTDAHKLSSMDEKAQEKWVRDKLAATAEPRKSAETPAADAPAPDASTTRQGNQVRSNGTMSEKRKVDEAIEKLSAKPGDEILVAEDGIGDALGEIDQRATVLDQRLNALEAELRKEQGENHWWPLVGKPEASTTNGRRNMKRPYIIATCVVAAIAFYFLVWPGLYETRTSSQGDDTTVTQINRITGSVAVTFYIQGEKQVRSQP